MSARGRVPARALGVALAIVAAAACAGCARHEERPASTLTESQRDSVLARSGLPGAGAIGRAEQAAGIEAKHATTVDSSAR
jgi:hypothetical protein